MDLISAIILGVLQGVTEWLPVSSSGQGMAMMMGFFGLSAGDAFSLVIYLHVGTLLAVVVRFRDDLRNIVVSVPRFREDKLVQFIVVSTVFNAVVGIPVYLWMKGLFSSSYGGLMMSLIGGLLIATGLVLHTSKGAGGGRSLENIGFWDMAAAGVSQGFAILPGISRSGITVSALLLLGVRNEDALRLSFLMSVPAVVGANMLELVGGSIGVFEPQVILVGVLFSFLVGYVSIEALMSLAQRIRFDLFCIGFGLFTLVLTAVS